MKFIRIAGAVGIIQIMGVVAHAQTVTPGPGSAMPRSMQSDQMGPGDWKAITEARVAVVKAALQLTTDQAKLWPAVEDAIRARAAAREKRLETLAARMNSSSEPSAVELMKMRGDTLVQKGESLKKLADAWQPLAATLTPDQKRRLLFLTVHVLREVRDAMDSRFANDEDEDED